MRTFKMVLVVVSSIAFLLALATQSFAAGVRIEDDDLYLRYSGTWRYGWQTAASGASVRASSKSGSSLSASFDGTGCALISRTGPDRGKARIYLDGAVVNWGLSTYSSQLSGPRSVWSTDTLAPGIHTLKVVVLGTREPASSGNWVVVDAVDVYGAPAGSRSVPGTVANNGNYNLLTQGRWWTSARSAAIYGSSARTSAQGASVTLRFRGNAVYWIGRKDGQSGKADVYLDGRRVATVGQLSTTTKERRVVWSVSGLPWGEHNVTIKATGKPVWSGRGVAVDLDAFAVNGTVLKALRPTPFNYPWPTYIVIDKSSFRLYWVKNGILVKSYPVAHGKVSSPTPSRVWRIDAKYMTDPSSVYGPRKMRLFKRVSTSSGYSYVFSAYGIHGTNQPWVIGTQASHGCIRMYNRDVLELWPQVPLHTMVVTRD